MTSKMDFPDLDALAANDRTPVPQRGKKNQRGGRGGGQRGGASNAAAAQSWGLDMVNEIQSGAKTRHQQ